MKKFKQELVLLKLLRIFIKKDMKATYQPFILTIVEEVFEELKDEINPLEESKEYLCKYLTQRFLDGKLSEGDEGLGIFETENDVNRFVIQCEVNESLQNLMDRGFINSYDDAESFFLTEEGKSYCKEVMKLPEP